MTRYQGCDVTRADLTDILRLHDLWRRADPAGKRADLAGANLTGANLTGAYLTGAHLAGAHLAGATLTGAHLADANLAGADLTDANLTGADLSGADLADADLTGADLGGADLTRADLTRATLTWAAMSDGRSWEEYRTDHLAGICTSPEVHARAVAAWGSHQWASCPMHSALGISGTTEISDAALRRNVAAWVALYDAGLLQPYTTTTKDTP